MRAIESTVLAVIDVQGRLVEAMWEKARFLDNLQRLVRGARALGLPWLWTEQNPDRMGPTLPAVAEPLNARPPIPKMTFSCWRAPAFAAALKASGRGAVLLAGIETHVCVYQTAADLVSEGYAVDVVADACSSRTAENRALGLDRIRACGAGVTSVESALFELMGTAEHPAFREILKIVK